MATFFLTTEPNLYYLTYLWYTKLLNHAHAHAACASLYRAAIVALLSIHVDSMLGQLNLSLVPSQHNGYEVSCFGLKDGSIDLTVSGGTAPYSFVWSTRATMEDVANLPAGFYAVTVTDANQLNGRAEITLNEPDNPSNA